MQIDFGSWQSLANAACILLLQGVIPAFQGGYLTTFFATPGLRFLEEDVAVAS
jgi:hypothetical protein